MPRMTECVPLVFCSDLGATDSHVQTLTVIIVSAPGALGRGGGVMGAESAVRRAGLVPWRLQRCWRIGRGARCLPDGAR